MSTPDAWKLKVNYKYDELILPHIVKVSNADRKHRCWCQKCGIPYVTSLYYKDTQLCTWCSGHCPTKDQVKHEKHLDYMRKKARERRNEKI